MNTLICLNTGTPKTINFPFGTKYLSNLEYSPCFLSFLQKEATFRLPVCLSEKEAFFPLRVDLHSAGSGGVVSFCMCVAIHLKCNC